MATKVSTFEPLLREEVIYRILDKDIVEGLTKQRASLSASDYRRLVIEAVVENLKPDLIDKIAGMTPEQAKKASNCLYRSAVTLNPTLESFETQPERQTNIKPLDKKKAFNVLRALSNRIVGQDEALERIASRIKQAAAGLSSPGRPRAILLLAGPSGVGKTLTAKALQEILFPDSKIVRVDCSEFAESHTRARLIGSPPGYVGFDMGGQLTEEVKQHPNSVILLDEVEKAHPTLFDLFLQVFDEGFLTDGRGDRADFTGTVIVMTSNIGTQQLGRTPIGFNSKQVEYQEMARDVTDRINRTFRTEFLGRIDDIIVFRPLSPSDLAQIAKMQLGDLRELMDLQGIQFRWSKKVIDWLVDHASSHSYGAREISRTIAKNLRDPLAEFVLSHDESCVLRAQVTPHGAIRLTPGKSPARGQMKNPL